ncbi:antiviral protein Ski8p [Trichomonascus vanleenenianus]|uniref:SKI complex subunit WD repeat protein SKI8 n=1 Tax=Trichomonascus vanleenenianus TaxID=2268995 RepID=UPI003EC9E690
MFSRAPSRTGGLRTTSVRFIILHAAPSSTNERIQKMSHAYIATNAIIDAHESDIYAVATCETYTATGSGDGRIILWENGKQDPEPIVLHSAKQGIHHLSIDFTGKILAAVGFDARLLLYDLTTLKPLEGSEKIVSECQYVWAISFARESFKLAVSTIEGLVHLWDLESFEKINTFTSNRSGFGVAVDVSPTGEMVACGYEKGGLYLFDVGTGRLAYSLTGHSSAIRSVAFSPKGTMLAAAGDSGIVALYSTSSGEHIANLTGHNGWIFGVHWNETGEYLASVGYDGLCKVWSLESRSNVATQSESNQPLLAVKWMKKGWGKGIFGGYHQGIATVGIEKTLRWYREAAE